MTAPINWASLKSAPLKITIIKRGILKAALAEDRIFGRHIDKHGMIKASQLKHRLIQIHIVKKGIAAYPAGHMEYPS